MSLKDILQILFEFAEFADHLSAVGERLSPVLSSLKAKVKDLLSKLKK